MSEPRYPSESSNMKELLLLLALAMASVPQLSSANVAGGGIGQGADVTFVPRPQLNRWQVPMN